MSDISEKALEPLLRLGRWFMVASALLVALAVLTLVALYIYNTTDLPPTTLEPEGHWGIHLTNFVFFIGLGLGFALVAALVRLRRTDWGVYANRLAIIMAVMAFTVAAFHLLFQIGSLSELIDHVIYGQVDSPFLWDGILVIFLFIATITYMYMPMVPDLIRASMSVKEIKAFYRVLSFGFIGNPMQKVRIRRYAMASAITVLVVLVLMTTVMSWAFEAVTPQPVWNKAITGPVFIMESLVVGMAFLIVLLAALRKMGDLGEFITPDVFVKMGRGLLIAILVYIPLLVVQTLTTTYEVGGDDVSVADMVWTGDYAYITWAVLFFGLVIPMLILLQPRLRSLRSVLVAASMTGLVMWFKTYLVVVPGLTHHLQPVEHGIFVPDLPELVLMVGSFAFFAILMLSMTRFFPMISIWEVEEHLKAEEKGEVTTA